MSNPADTTIRSLEEIMGILANVWPGDRENIMKAGARLEETIEAFEGKSTLLNDLIGKAWKALIHMYEKDECFFSVRAAVLQAVNTIREFAVNDGDIAVEVFEKASGDLDKALRGESESLMEDTAPAAQEAPASTPASEESAGKEPETISAGDTEPVEAAGTAVAQAPPASTREESGEAADVSVAEVTLDDLASVVMQLSEENLDGARLAQLAGMVGYLADSAAGGIAPIMQQLRGKLAGCEERSPENPAGFLAYLSEKVEEAVAVEMNSDVMTAQDGSAATLTPVAADLPGRVDEAGADAPDGAASDGAAPEGAAVPDAAGAADADSDAEQSADFRVPDDLDTSLLQDFITECNEQIEEAESALLDLEVSPGDDELINKVFRSFHTIKGTSAFMGLTPMSEFAHAVETLLDMVRDSHLAYDSACADITLTSIDIIKSFLEKSGDLQGGGVLTMPDDYDWLMDVLSRVSDYGTSPEEALAEVKGRPVAQMAATGDEVSGASEASGESKAIAASRANAESRVVAAVPAQASAERPAEVAPETPSTRKQNSQNGQKTSAQENGQPKRSESEASVRVNVERLDRVIDMVGELVIAHSVVAQSGLISSDPDLSRKVSHSTKILRELQDTSLTLRMVPLKATFQKMNRLVRDLAKKSGKTVSYATEGEDTEIDRNMVDIINEPLVHLLRNALDHGIEDVQTRESKGKPGIARIWLRAFQAGGKVIIEIEDDGKGLDKEKIMGKAIAKGLVEPSRKLSESEIYKLIFLPGFSTADKVSDLSGRGVGMDVVRRSIDRLQGKVDVYSKPDKGTKISLELPFTLAITDGMLVRIGTQQFIVPTINIDMTFRAKEEELFTILGDSEQVRFRGNAIPVIRLHRMFGIGDAIESIDRATLLVVNNNKKKYALLVDEVVGQQQLVGKSIDMPVKMRNISGGAILGDGRVGLILDTVALLN